MDRRVIHKWPSRRPCRRPLVALAFALPFIVARPASSQLAGMPMPFSPSAQPGIRLFGDFAGGDNPFHTLLGARAQLNLAYVTLNVLLADRTAADAAWGGTFALNLLRGASRPLSLSIDAGYGTTTVDVDGRRIERRDVPIGVGVALEPQVPGVDFEPWAAARLLLRRSEMDATFENGGAPVVDNAVQPVKAGLGLSAGVNVRTAVLTKIGLPLPGFGFHAALDLSSVPRASSGGSDTALLFDIGISYHFEFSAFPAHGIIPPPCDPTSAC